MEFVCKNLNETKKVAGDFAKGLKLKQDTATVVALQGNLGSGKTAFSQFVAKALGIKERITSPTFVILKKYSISNSDSLFKNLFHIDAYRLKSGEDLEKLGWKEIISNPKNLILLEWAELVFEVVPKNAILINFEFIDEETRKIKFDSF